MKIKGFPIHLAIYFPSSGHTVRSVIPSSVVAFGVSGRPRLWVRPGTLFGPSFILPSSRSACRVVPACGFVRAHSSVRRSFFGRRVRCVGSSPLAGSSGHTVRSVIPSSVLAVGSSGLRQRSLSLSLSIYIYIDQRFLSLHVFVQVRGLEHQHSNLYTTFAQLHLRSHLVF